MIANENYPWMKKPVINKEDFMLLIKNFSKFNYLRRFGAGCCIMKTCLLYWLQYGVDYIMSMHYGGLLWNSENSQSYLLPEYSWIFIDHFTVPMFGTEATAIILHTEYIMMRKGVSEKLQVCT